MTQDQRRTRTRDRGNTPAVCSWQRSRSRSPSAPGLRRELRSFALIAISAAAYCFLRSRPDPAGLVAHAGDRREPRTRRVLPLRHRVWIRHLAISERRPLRRMERGLIVAGVVMEVLAFIPGVLITPPIRHFSVAWLGVRYTQPTGTSLGVGCVVFNITAILVASFGGDRRWCERLACSTLPMLRRDDAHAGRRLRHVVVLADHSRYASSDRRGGNGRHRRRDGRRPTRAGSSPTPVRLEALSTRLEHEVASRTDELLNARGAGRTARGGSQVSVASPRASPARGQQSDDETDPAEPRSHANAARRGQDADTGARDAIRSKSCGDTTDRRDRAPAPRDRAPLAGGRADERVRRRPCGRQGDRRRHGNRTRSYVSALALAG